MKKTYTQDRPIEQQACMAFVAVSVVTATIGFWSKGILPGVLLSVLMASVVFLLSKTIERVQEAWQTNNKVTAIVAAIVAFGFALLEANLNHIGLAKLDADYDVIAEGAIVIGAMQVDYIWIACGFISVANVFASFAYARTLEDKSVKEEPMNPGKALVAIREQRRLASVK